MDAMTSLFTGVSIVYSAVCSRAGKEKYPSSLSLHGLCVGNSPVTGEFPAQKASNAENVSIWWRHHLYHKYRDHFTNNFPIAIEIRWTFHFDLI